MSRLKWILLWFAVLAVLLSVLMVACGDDDDDDDDSGTDDDDDDSCGIAEVCEHNIECMFDPDEETCETRLNDCLDPEAFVQCLCACFSFASNCSDEYCLAECYYDICE